MLTAKSDPATIVKSTTLTPEQIKSYKEEGYVLIRNLISPETAEALRREVMDIMDKIGLPFTKLKQTTEYLEGGDVDALVNSQPLRSVAEQVLEGPSTVYMPFTAVKSGGGGGRFHFHQDNQYTRHDGPSCNLWFALMPMTAENGCLQVVPRSHLNGTYESMGTPDDDSHRRVKWEPKDFVTVEMQPGDCVAFTRLTVHGSGQNVTQDPRVAYAIQYHRNDVKWFERETNSWKLLSEFPRWKVGPVKTISVPKGKTDGH
jgi:hypothetical protein